MSQKVLQEELQVRRCDKQKLKPYRSPTSRPLAHVFTKDFLSPCKISITSISKMKSANLMEWRDKKDTDPLHNIEDRFRGAFWIIILILFIYLSI